MDIVGRLSCADITEGQVRTMHLRGAGTDQEEDNLQNPGAPRCHVLQGFVQEMAELCLSYLRLLHFSPKVCPHWGVLTVRVKAEVGSGYTLWSPAFLPLSMCISTAQARTKSAPRGFHDLGPRLFPWQFSHKIALVTCPCTFWLRRLAQNSCPGLGPFYDDLARVSWCTLGGSWWNPVRGPWMILWWSLWEDLVKVWLTSSKRSSHDLAQVLRRSCVKTLQMPCIRGACMAARCSWEFIVSSSCKLQQQVLFWRSCGILFGVLAWRSWSKFLTWEALVEILLKSFKRSLHDLVQVLVRRSCGDTVEIILKRSLH